MKACVSINQILLFPDETAGKSRTHPRSHASKIFGPFLILATTLLTGCAIQYVDRETGTTHLYGIGHMRVRVPKIEEGKSGTVTGLDIIGISTGLGASQTHLTVGWRRSTELLLFDNTRLRLEWPNNDSFDIHFGSLPPFLIEEVLTEPSDKKGMSYEN